MPRHSAAVYRRRRFGVFGVLGALLLGLAYLPMTLFAPLASADAVPVSVVEEAGAAATPILPGYGASAFTSPQFPDLVVTSGSDAPQPLASITKIVTVLTVLDAKPLATGEAGPAVTMTAADVALYDSYRAAGGKVVPVRAGWVFTQRELLQLSLIESANNYATGLAVWAFGSQDAFVTAANAWLEKQGLGDAITIVEPTGLDDDNVGTAAALLKLGALALADPTVAEIVSTKSVEMHDVGELESSNGMLGVDGVDGIKTGTLSGIANLLFSADVTIGEEDVTIIGVALGGPDHDVLDGDIRTMLDSIEAGFHWIDLADAGESFASYTSLWGQTSDAVAGTSAGVLTWGDTPITSDVTLDPVLFADAGTAVGSVVFTAGGRTVTVPLTLGASLDDPGPGWRLANPLALF